MFAHRYDGGGDEHPSSKRQLAAGRLAARLDPLAEKDQRGLPGSRLEGGRSCARGQIPAAGDRAGIQASERDGPAALEKELWPLAAIDAGGEFAGRRSSGQAQERRVKCAPRSGIAGAAPGSLAAPLSAAGRASDGADAGAAFPSRAALSREDIEPVRSP